MSLKLFYSVSVVGILAFLIPQLQASTWTRLTNNPPFSSGGLSTQLLLTDGSVMFKQIDARSGVASGAIWKLTPDIKGNYINGTWSQLASLPKGYLPLDHASAVLADGRVIYEGGEYNGNRAKGTWTNLGAIYDPVKNQWAKVNPPPFFPHWPSRTGSTGDAQCVVLPDGTFMLACAVNKQAALLNPKTMTWTETGTHTKYDVNDEEGWTLLPDGTVLTVDTEVNGVVPKTSELYNPTTGKWSMTPGTTPNALTDAPLFEFGPAVLRPDGTVFQVGGDKNGNTAIYDYRTGTWATGPTLPIEGGVQLSCTDGAGALLPNGNVLIGVSPYEFGQPLYFFEFDLSNNLTMQPTIPNSSFDSSYYVNMLVLPTGQVLVTDLSRDVEIYTPDNISNYQTAWQPTISQCPGTVTRGTTYQIFGTLFNGMSQGAAYGDDYQSATNYPLVRITNTATGHVFYCRTHDHSCMAVACTDPVSTFFDVPATMETGASSLEVVANGIPSQPVQVTVNR